MRRLVGVVGGRLRRVRDLVLLVCFERWGWREVPYERKRTAAFLPLALRTSTTWNMNSNISGDEGNTYPPPVLI